MKKPIYRCESCDSVVETDRKYCGERCKQIELCKSMGTMKYKTKHVAPTFQEMCRAEWGAVPSGYVLAIRKGELVQVHRDLGQCVCVTCSNVCPWRAGTFTSKLDCGHFLSGRGSILFEEDCVAPQCAGCNQHHGGRPLEFRKWMEAVRGLEVIERLELQKHQPMSRTRDQLVDMRLSFNKRLKAAQAKMKGNQ